ncbi:MAG: sialate O-acetylesterase [Mariniblastus sp.]
MSSFAQKFLFIASLAIFSFSTGNQCSADVRLPGFFTDHMVMQQQVELKIWGWAEPGETIAVTLGESTKETAAADDGTWQVKLPAMKASKDPLTLTVKGQTKITLRDILIGEVWLCSGQSNMEWSVRASGNPDAEIAAANYPMIRHMKVGRDPQSLPVDDIKSQWQVCSPDTVAGFTAAGYYMARHLHKELDVPIGLINSSWGGTRVEPWIPASGFKKSDALQEISESVEQKIPRSPLNKALLENHMAAMETWMVSAKSARDAGKPVEPNPVFPAELAPFKSHQDPTMLYNGMIHALVGYPIRGAIWYQGESNHVEGDSYYDKKQALISGWRELWGIGDFPFYFVQIAPYKYGNEAPDVLAEFWEVQEKTLQVPNTGMVITTDIATVNNIHPPNKQEVGRRLALLSLKNDHGKDIVASGPKFESIEMLGDKIKVNFSNTGGGLTTRDGKAPDWFEVVDASSEGFQMADATIDGDSVLLTSSKVKTPVAMRFCWNKIAEPNLVGGTKLPVGAFRAGEVPGFTSTIPGFKDYQLVYKIDLAKLSTSPAYDMNRSKTVGKFDRVGYLLELESDRGPQKLFVSMDAFTDDATKIGIPVLTSNAVFQMPVKAMDVYSNVEGIETGQAITTGNIEFWPHNYGATNFAKIPSASATMFDFGDQKGAPADGYGSMQVHNHAAKQTLFAINHFKQGANADIGIGNSEGNHRDWTFTGSGSTYSKKTLSIFVR